MYIAFYNFSFQLKSNLYVSPIQKLDRLHSCIFIIKHAIFTRYLLHLVFIQMLLDMTALGLNRLNSVPS